MIANKPSFYSELASLPKALQHKVDSILKHLDRHHGRHPDAKKLETQERLYRIRVGNYRLIYEKGRSLVIVHCIRLRKDVYRTLGAIKEEAFDTQDIENAIKTPDINLENESHPRLELTFEKLSAWNIPLKYHQILSACKSEQDLLDAGIKDVPNYIITRITDLLFPKNLNLLNADATYRLPDGETREKVISGDLLNFLLILDEEQTRLAELNIENARGPILVKGGPGSGKSTIALHRIKKILERESQKLLMEPTRILFATYTKALTNANKELLNNLLGTKHHTVEIRTVDSLAHEITTKCKKPYSAFLNENHPTTLQYFREARSQVRTTKSFDVFQEKYLIDEIFQVIESQGIMTLEQYLTCKRHGRKAKFSQELRKILWEIYEIFLERMMHANLQTWDGLRSEAYGFVKNKIYTQKYDYVIIDEAQDLSPSGIRLMVELCKHPSALYLTADSNQSLYQSGFSWKNIHEDLKVVGRTHELKQNYRNSREISLAVENIRSFLNDPDSEVNQPGVRKGAKPRVILTSPNTEIAQLKQHIKRVCSETRHPLTNVAILIAGPLKYAKERGIQLAQDLKATGLPANYFPANQLRLDARCIKIMSLYASKGLEFPIVILWDINNGILPRHLPELPEEEQLEEQYRDRRLLYVGASRAMQDLTIFTQNDKVSPFIKELDKSLWNFPLD